jgi:hypothetical protein
VQKLNIGRNTKVRLNNEGFGAHSYYLLRCQRMSASITRFHLYKRRFPPIATLYWINNLRSLIPLGDHLSPLYGHPQPNRTHHPTTPSAEGRVFPKDDYLQGSPLTAAVGVLIYPFVTSTTNFDVYNGQAYQGQFRRNILPNLSERTTTQYGGLSRRNW